jgi:gamma-tubulin complex component 3
MLEQKTDTQFQDMIDSIYVDTSNTLMEILMKKYKLMDHFNALRRYLLLGQGDFIRHLMDLMEYLFIFVCALYFLKNISKNI